MAHPLLAQEEKARPTGPHPLGSRRTRIEPSRYATAELDPQPAAAALARRLTRDCLAHWDLRGLIADAEAIASELVTNAVAAVPPASTGLTITYAIHGTPTGLHIYAWDIGPGYPQAARADHHAETGRGLTIIDALTDRNWGWWPTPASGGKVVWATLTAIAAPAGEVEHHPNGSRADLPAPAGPEMTTPARAESPTERP
jgi:anti-sigma regulatory factor (Ser/Thr protein kinase)